MGDNTIHILFSILRSVFHGNQMSDADKRLVTDDLLKDVIKLASKHDIAHLIALGILNNDLADEETKTQLQQITFRAVYRYEKLNYELKQVCEALEKAQMPFLPLKGSVIRKHYPAPWMRTSCDIDVLVHEKNLRNAVSCLVENLKYTEHWQNSHDISLFSPSGVHLELHYDLVENHIVGSSSKILADVWNVVTVKEDCSYHYEMPDDMFYFYHIAHMAKHFMYNRADGAVFQSDGAKAFYSKKLQEKSAVIPNPIMGVKEEYLYNPEQADKAITFAGRFETVQKRQDIMLEAMKKVLEKYPDYKLVFYGDGENEDEIKTLASEMKMNDRVIFAGVSDNLVRDISKCEIYAITSDYEGIPNTLMEAMSVGMPCVSTDCSPGGARMLINTGENGTIVPCGDAVAVANAILYYIENKQI